MKVRIKSKESIANSPRIKIDDSYIYNFNKSNTDHITINSRDHVKLNVVQDIDNWSKNSLNDVYYYSRSGSFIFNDTIEERF